MILPTKFTQRLLHILISAATFNIPTIAMTPGNTARSTKSLLELTSTFIARDIITCTENVLKASSTESLYAQYYAQRGCKLAFSALYAPRLYPIKIYTHDSAEQFVQEARTKAQAELSRLINLTERCQNKLPPELLNKIKKLMGPLPVLFNKYVSSKHSNSLDSVADFDSWLITQSSDSKHIWNVNAPALVHLKEISKYHQLPITSLCVEEKWLLTQSIDTKQLWDLSAFEQEPALTLKHDWNTVSKQAYFTSNSRFLFSVDPHLALWELSSEKPTALDLLQKNVKYHLKPLTSACASNTGRWLFSQSPDAQGLWDLSPSPPVLISNFADHHAAIYKIIFSTDDQWLLSYSSDTVNLWFVTQNSLMHVTNIHNSDNQSYTIHAQFSPNTQWLVTLAEGNIFLWNLHQGKAAVAKVLHGFKATFSQDSELLFTYSGQCINLWKLKDKPSLTKNFDATTISDAKMSPSGTWLLIKYENTIHVWNARHHPPLHSLRLTCQAEVELTKKMFSSDDMWLFIDHQLWNLAYDKPTLALDFATYYNHKSMIDWLFSPDSTLLYTSASERIYLWDLSHDIPIRILKYQGPETIYFSNDTTWSVIRGKNVLYLWQIKNNSQQYDLLSLALVKGLCKYATKTNISIALPQELLKSYQAIAKDLPAEICPHEVVIDSQGLINKIRELLLWG